MFLNIIIHVREIHYRLSGAKRAAESGRAIPRKIRSVFFWRKKLIEENVMLPKLKREVKLSYRRFSPGDAVECSLIAIENGRKLRDENGIKLSEKEHKEYMEFFSPDSIVKVAKKFNYRIVELDGKVIGTVGFHLYGGKYARIISLHVDPCHQGIGVGRFMVMKLLGELKKVYKVEKVTAGITRYSERLFSRYFPGACEIQETEEMGVKDMTLDLRKIKI